MSAIQQLLTDHIGIWTVAETEKKSGRGRPSGIGASLYGIKKLRELILELAVRGKLVQQDANDKSARELFTCIEAEKTKLFAEGRIKKNKLLSAIADDDQPFPLPLEWTWLRLEDLMPQFQNGASSRGDVDGEAVVVLRLADIKDRRIVLDDPRELLITPSLIDKYRLSKSDILIVRVNGSADLVGGFIVCEENFDGIYCDHFIRMKISQDIMNSSFLGVIGSSGLIRNRINDLFITTAGQKTVNQGHISSLLVPVPSIAEQHRIVAKVDELMVLCDQMEAHHGDAADAHEQLVSHLLGTLTQSQSAADFNANWQRIAAHFDTLFTTEASIDALKQTLLQLAVMGKLVAQDANDEPASKLLKRIQMEKDKLVSEGKIKKEKLLAAIGADELRYSAPTGWGWVRFNVVAQTRLGKMLDQAKNKGVFRPYLRNTNVQWSRFELDDLKEMRFENHELDEYRLNAGDLVICEGGEPGRSAVWENQLEDMFIQKALHRARTWPGVSPYYLNIHLKVDVENGYLEKFFTGATIKHFSGEKLSLYPIALPPASEQLRILARLNELMALCNQLRSRITDSNQQQKKLADVLVEHAVTG